MKNLTVRKMKTVSLMILLSLQFALFAQTKSDYITPIDRQSVILNEIQKTKFERLGSNPEYRSIQFVQLGKLQGFIENSELTFNIPGTEEKYVALVKDFEYTSPIDYIWKGDLIDQDGSIVIFCEKGSVFGHILIENQEYEIQVFDDKNVFIEYDTEYISRLRCGTAIIPEETKQPIEKIDTTANKNKSCTGNVRVLVLYTTAAQNTVSSISSTATLAINSVNDALSNSDLSWGDLHVSKAGLVFYNFNETNSMNDDLYDLATSSTAQNLRNQYQADLVILLTDGNYGSNLGIAYIGPNNYWAYSIVEAVNATSGFTFAHETGHLFGCLHEEDANPPGVTGVYEFPHKFTKGWWFWKKKYRTILQTNAWSSYTRIQHYSNPDVEYKNKATGTSTHDNARKLEEESCTVENFRPYDQPPSVYITGPSKGNNSGTYTWTAHGSGGQPPYSYLWKYSLDGTNYNGTFGTGQSVTAQLPLDNDLYLKVIMTDNNQQQAIDYFVTINMSGHPGHKSGENSSIGDSTANDMNFTIPSQSITHKDFGIKTIYPNPAQNSTTVKYSLEHEGIVQISITNSLGEVVQMHESNHSLSGVYYKTLQSSELKNGVYFVKISSGDLQDIHKLIIQ